MQFRESTDSLSRGTRMHSGRRVLINVTSLIDVLFLLLIFFMVSSTFLEQPGMKLELPAAKTADITQIKSAVVYLLQDGRMFLNEQEIGIDKLAEELRAILPQSPEMALNLFADKSVPHGDVVRVMDIARQVGVKKLTIATLPEASGK